MRQLPKPKSYVVYAAEQQKVAAGKRSVLELHFRVVDGFHVNSHTPKSELLIPTQIALQPAAGVKAEAVEYPAGTSYSFSFDPTEKLDVYSGRVYGEAAGGGRGGYAYGGWNAAVPGLRSCGLLSAQEPAGAGDLHGEVAFHANSGNTITVGSLGTPVCD